MLQFPEMITTQFGVVIKRFFSNKAMEVFISIVNPHFITKGVIQVCSCVYTPQKIGLPERLTGYILSMARALLFQAHMQKMYWGKAILIPMYLIH